MKNLSTLSKVMVGFIAGAFIAGSVAVAVTPDLLPTKVCVDNRTKALYSTTNGSCTKTRTLMEVAGSGVNVESIAAAVSPSVVSIAVSAASGSGSGSGVIYRTSASSSFIITNNHVIESAATAGSVRVELNNGDYEKATIVGRHCSTKN
jgi:putative serine protease PepD